MNPNTLSNTTTASERIEARVNPVNTAALMVGAGGAMNFQNMTDIMEFAKLMSISKVAVPKHLRDDPGACLAVVIQASEWQMSPYAVANKSYSVNDRLAYEAQLVSAVILRRAPIKSRFSYAYDGEGDKRRCTVSVVTTDGEVVTHTSPAFGLITPKNSPLWKSDPDQQLGYHTARAMCRRHFPDVLLGVYTMDELIDSPQERQATGRVVTESAGQLKNPYLGNEAETKPSSSPANQATTGYSEEMNTPAQNLEPVPESPMEVSESTERDALMADIRSMLADENSTPAKFAPLCRKAGFLAVGVHLTESPIESLRLIHENRLAILRETN